MNDKVTKRHTEALYDEYPLILKKGGKGQPKTLYRVLRRSLTIKEKELASQCRLGSMAMGCKAVLAALIESDSGLTYKEISDVLKQSNRNTEEGERRNRSNRKPNYDSRVAVSTINAGFKGVVLGETDQTVGVYSTSRLEGNRVSPKDLNNDIYRLCVLQKIK